jgi:hypothetical protein
MATHWSAWTGEKPRKAGNGARRDSAARSGENVGSISPTGCAQDVQGSQARDHQVTLARGGQEGRKVLCPFIAHYARGLFASGVCRVMRKASELVL